MQPPVPGGGQLVVVTRHAWGAWRSPTIFIDGWRVPAQQGANTYPVAPGPHRVEVCMVDRGTSRVNPAAIDVVVPPGQQVVVHYSQPIYVWQPGAIGLEPRRTPGMGCGIGMLGCLGLMILLSLAMLMVLLGR